LSTGRTLVTIVTGPSAAVREEAIAAALQASPVASAADSTIALLLEGIPDGSERFGDDVIAGLQRSSRIHLLPAVRIAPGCMCCAGNLAMRVHLNRLLRVRPARLYLGVAPGTHLASLQGFLAQPPYAALLALDDVLDA
jgi:hypothetical protein